VHRDDPTLLGYDAIDTGVFLTPDDRRRSLYVVGRPGTGKTTLLGNMMAEDIRNGRGATFIDPHGDEAERLADTIPPHRIKDVIYWEPYDPTGNIAFNPLANVPAEQRELVTNQIITTFIHIWDLDIERNPRLLYILPNAIMLLLENRGSTLLGLSKLLTDDEYRKRLLKNCTDRAIKTFWIEEYDPLPMKMKREWTAPILNKAGQFRLSPILRRSLGQQTNRLDIKDIMDNRKCLIVNLSKGKIGEQTAHLIGSLLATSFSQAANARASIPEDKREDHHLYIDEFQNFTSPVFISTLPEARKYRLSLTLAHQFASQIPEAIHDAVIGTTSTLIVFRVGMKDAPLLGKELGMNSETTLAQTANGQAWIKLLLHGIPQEPHIIRTLPPTERLGSLDAVRANTRARYLTPRDKIDRILDQFFPEPKPKKRRNPDA
jgi:DNA helicase HerA-like ATPase